MGLAFNLFTDGGMVSGLEGSGFQIRNNGGDTTDISANGGFVFATPLEDGSLYIVTVRTNPIGPGQTCNITNQNGIVFGANVTDVAVTCVTI